MPRTPEQISDQNRINAEKSTGPKSEEGKAKARANALKHGMCATVLAMPQEDPALVAAREQEWNDYYNPQSPGAKNLVNRCVHATLLADRVELAHDEAVVSQVRNADEDWLNEKADNLADLVALLLEKPAVALRLLRRDAMGCHYLVGRLKFLSEVFNRRGFWSVDECGEVVRILGATYDSAGLKANADAFKLFFYNNLIPSDDPRALALTILTDDTRPHELWNAFDVDNLPDRKWCQEWIQLFLRDKAKELVERGKRLAETIDAPDRAGAKNRALILKDEKEARLFLRYGSEARNGFQRAFTTLLKTLESDQERAENGTKTADFEESRNEATFVPAWKPEDRPDPMRKPVESRSEETSAADSGPEPEPSRNEATSIEEQELEAELLDLDRQLEEAENAADRWVIQNYRDSTARTYERMTLRRCAQ